MDSNKKYKKLVANSIVFAAANFGSSVLRFIIVPFYTYYMTTTEYGTVDIITTTVSLVLPFFLLAINEAVLRYSLKKEVDNSKILMTSLFVVFVASIVYLNTYFIIGFTKITKDVWLFFYVLLIIQGLYNILSNYTRGIGKSVVFALGGILNTFVLLVLNVVLLAVFKMGLKGYLISLVLSFLVPVVFFLFMNRKTFVISIKEIDLSLLKSMLKYSIPLIPTAMMWWVMNASDRYVITWFLGVSATGIYAVSHKIPTVISMLYSIFQQAWQISAVEESVGNDKEAFYTNIYNVFCGALFLAASMIILIDKPLIQFVVAESYVSSWKYVPILIICSVFSALAGFLGINYVVAEKTVGAFTTAAVTAVINFVLNIILTPLMGMQGTAVATLVGFVVLWLIRSIDTQKFVKFDQQYKKITVEACLLLVQSIVLICEVKYHYAIQVVILIAMLIVNRDGISGMLKLAGNIVVKFTKKEKKK